MDIKENITHGEQVVRFQLEALPQVAETAERMAQEMRQRPEYFAPASDARHVLEQIPALQDVHIKSNAKLSSILTQAHALLNEHIKNSTDINNADNSNADDWFQPTWAQVGYIRVNNDTVSIDRIVSEAIRMLTERTLLRFVYEMCKEIEADICAPIGCDQHRHGYNGGMVNRDLTESYISTARQIARRALDKHEDHIRSMLLESVFTPGMRLAMELGGKDIYLDGKRAAIIDEFAQPLAELSKTTPGIAGLRAWGICYGSSVRVCEDTTQQSIVRWVGDATGLKRSAQPWKILGNIPAKAIFEIMGKRAVGEIKKDKYQGAVGDIERDKYQGLADALRVYAKYGNRRKARKQNVKRLMEAIGSRFYPRYLHPERPMQLPDRPTQLYEPLYGAYVQESLKPASERAGTLAEIDRQFINMLDWADDTIEMARRAQTVRRSMDVFMEELINDGHTILPKRKWNGLKKLSDEWHKQQIALALAMENEGEVIIEWESAIEEYTVGDYVVKPLTTDRALYAQGAAAHNCVGSLLYAQRCQEGSSRIFSISRVSDRRFNVENPLNIVATVELANWTSEVGKWSVRQSEGFRHRPVRASVKEVIDDLLQRYNDAYQKKATTRNEPLGDHA